MRFGRSGLNVRWRQQFAACVFRQGFALRVYRHALAVFLCFHALAFAAAHPVVGEGFGCFVFEGLHGLALGIGVASFVAFFAVLGKDAQRAADRVKGFDAFTFRHCSRGRAGDGVGACGGEGKREEQRFWYGIHV